MENRSFEDAESTGTLVAEVAELRARLVEAERQRDRLEAVVREQEAELEAVCQSAREPARLVTLQAAQLSETRDKALSSTRAKAAFLAMISHEVRTPLNGILGMTEFLLDSELNDVQREQILTVQRAGGALLALINDILDFSKVESGRMELESVDFPLITEIENAVEILADAAQRKGLELVVDVRPQVPERVAGDPVRLRQVLLNLIGNAVKFTVTGEIVVTVELDGRVAHEGEVGLCVSVRDTGIGIDEDRVEALFEPFVQAHPSTARQYGGSGLGLAITRQLVELMGGSIEVETGPGKGSCFTVRVPFRRSSTAAEELVQPAFTGVRVMCIEANDRSRRTLADLLARLGVEVVETTGTGAALEWLLTGTAEPCRAVLVDYQTAEREPQATHRLGGMLDRAGASLILLAPLAQRSQCEKLFAAPVLASLVKPVRRSHVVSALKRAVEGSSSAVPSEPAGPPGEVARSLRVLVVEDNLINQRVAAGLLDRLGHVTEIANDGAEGLEKLQQGGFDLVLLDCQMPVMDGYTMAREVRRSEAADVATPLIAMTANALRSDRQNCLDAGMDDFMTKPLTLDALQRVLDNWGGRSRTTAGHIERV